MKLEELRKNKKSVLVIDDTKTNLSIINQMLKDEYTVLMAKSGVHGIEIATSCVPDAILLDVLMPGMDGYETVVKLKENEATRQIPVIFVTAMANSEIEKKVNLFRAAGYITKPFNAEIVKSVLKSVIPS